MPVAQVAAVLGPRLTADWRAEDLVGYVEAHAGVTVLGRGASHSPLRYLIALIDRAVTAARPPLPCPARAVATRATAAATHAGAAASLDARRAEWDQRDAAAAPAGASSARQALAAAAARRQAAAQTTPQAHQRGAGTRQPDPEAEAILAAARARLAGAESNR